MGARPGAPRLFVAFEALPVFPLLVRMVTLWNIDGRAPVAVTEPPYGMRVAVLIPTYNEPVQVIAPTVAAACVLEPAHGGEPGRVRAPWRRRDGVLPGAPQPNRRRRLGPLAAGGTRRLVAVDAG